MKSRPYQSGVRIDLRVVLILCIAAFCAPRLFASGELASGALRIHRGDGAVVEYHAYPESRVKLLFPTGDALLGERADSEKWQLTSATILKRIQLFTVSDTQRRFNVMGAFFGEQLYIFDQLFCSENSPLMSQLIQATASAPKNGSEALVLAKLYLSLSYYHLEDPSRFVAYRSIHSASQNPSGTARSFSDMVGVSHSPLVSRVGTTYMVDFYAYGTAGVPSSGASRWQISIGTAGIVERMAAHHEGFHELRNNETSQTTKENRGVEYSPRMMANGSTDDGAKTELQIWDSSDGPGLERIHYYYQSHDKAEKRMQDYLQNALAVIESRSWLDSEGKIGGRQALLIMIDNDTKTLYGLLLSEDEASVLEYIGGCLRSLHAIQSPQLPDKH
jgi:hypothetical protein